MFTPELLLVSIVIFCFVTLLFGVSILIKRNDIADIAWGTGILLVATTSYLLQHNPGPVMKIVLFLVILWGVRLTVRIFLRNIKKGEDYRYKKWRDEWGRWFYVRSYFQVYLLQGLLMIVVGYSAIHASSYDLGSSLGITAALGITLWCIGYFFEVVGDYQLDKFIKNKPVPGSIMTTGLWKYTRHPNYFGEVTMWWAIWLIVSPLPFSYLSLVSPITITFLIFKVSGIPMLEKYFTDNPAFQEYKKKTSVFFPLPPRK